MTDFLAAALQMNTERGWLAMPLTLDANQLPKIPFVRGWTDLVRSEKTIRSLPWDEAKGLGLILGKQSSNLAALDIDDQDLTDTLIEMMVGDRPPLTIRTARKRGHIYVIEPEPSESTMLEIEWKGRRVGIELKSTGTQIAAPPTNGYSIAVQGTPIEGDIRRTWAGIAARLKSSFPQHFQELNKANANANYPPPWQLTVPKEKRNKTLYIEAHRLREAGMPIDMAIQLLSIRVKESYESGNFGMTEITRTIRSAYANTGVGVPDGRFEENYI